MVIIFDECHRSQFGDMHAGITKTFKNYHLFGFTGTPIFPDKASSGGRPDLKTTEQAFGKTLHTYTIVDAIADKNVLPFKVDYISTMLEGLPGDKKLKVATIFSFGANEEEPDGVVDENSEDTSGLDAGSRDFLDGAIGDYNRMFGTSYDTSSDKFKDVSEQAQKDFIRLYGAILQARNILVTFDEFSGNEILTERDVQDYHSAYIDLYNELRKGEDSEKANINDDLVFEMELIKQIEINIDYILMLIKQYHEGHIKDKEILLNINKAIDSSVELRNKRELINQFIASLDIGAVVDEDWQKFVEEKKIEELERIIKDENLNRGATYNFVKNAFRDGGVTRTGPAISKILPPVMV